MKRMNNDMAVSPIVATLVLIVVAVIGAVAVGTIMGTFSSDVSKKASADQAGSASQTEILIAGSTTVQPASEQIAKDYMSNNPGIKVTVQGGGSGAGWTSTLNSIVDIGAMSEDYKANPTKYVVPTGTTINQYKIGGSGIVIITNADSPANTTANITKADLKSIYSTTSAALPTNITAGTTVVTRADASGTADTFFKYIGYSSGQQTPAAMTGAYVYQATGNEGVISEVSSTAKSIGFADMGYVFSSSTTSGYVSGIQIVGLEDNGFQGVVTKAQIKTGCKDYLNNGKVSTGDYPLVRGLYYITNGEPSAVVKNYIQFAQSPGAQADFAAAGMFSNADLS